MDHTWPMKEREHGRLLNRKMKLLFISIRHIRENKFKGEDSRVLF